MEMIRQSRYQTKRAAGTYRIEGWVDRTSRSGCFGEKNYVLPLPEIEPLTLGRSAHSHAIFRAVPGFRQPLAR
jgi:hypothetical protein